MLRIGILGAGYWGPNLLRNFSSLKDVEIGAICDKDDSRLKVLKEKYPQATITTDHGSLFNDSDIDAVVIATPAGNHFELAKKALESKKHVLVEKPLALSSKECLSLIESSEKNRLVLMVGHTFVYSTPVKKLKEYLKNGEIGDLYYIFSQRLNLGRVRQDVNALWNFAPHDISIILHVLEKEPVSVSAKGLAFLQKNIEDVAYLNLDFDHGINANIHVSWLSPNKVRQMTFVGSRKMMVYDDVNAEKYIQIYDKGVDKEHLDTSFSEFDSFDKFKLILRAGDLHVPKFNTTEPLKVECQHFVECILKNKKPLSDGYDGLKVVKVLEAAQRSLKEEGRPVRIPK